MTDGYHKSALRLSSASPEERTWVLAQLDPEDRVRLAAALQDLRDSASPSGPTEGGFSAGPHDDAPYPPVNDALKRVGHEAMAALLRDEPDWVIALLVGEAQWPWVEGYLAQLSADRLQALGACVQRVNATVKPRSRAAAIDIVSERLESRDSTSTPDSPFDALLARLRRQDSVTAVTGQQA